MITKSLPILKDNHTIGYAFLVGEDYRKLWKITNHGCQVIMEISGGLNEKELDIKLKKEKNWSLKFKTSEKESFA